jgi:uncharacterized protein YqeY
VAVLRLVNSDIKRVEVDERRDLTDGDIANILNKMVKQRLDSLSQYRDAKRDDLADQEAYEIEVIKAFLPKMLSESELDSLIAQIIDETGASSMKDMGQVMAKLKDAAPGQIDMGRASALVKSKFS